MSWETVPLGDVASVDARIVQPSEIDGLLPYVGLEHIGPRGQLSMAARAEESGLKSAKNRFDQRHILFGKLRPNLGKVARPHAAGVCSTDIYPVLPSPRVSRDYLAHVLLTPEAISFASSRTSGANLPRISWGSLRQLPIPLPPLPEQRRIAAILDEADAMRVLSGVQESQLGELLDSFFDSVAGVPGRPSVTVGDLVESSQYGTSAKAGASGQFPILRMGNVTNDGRIDLTNMKFIDIDESDHARYLVHRGDLLFNRTNSVDLVGKTAVYREAEPRAFAGYLVRLRPKSPELGEYVAGYLNSRHGKLTLRKMAKSIVGMANINAREALSIRLPEPDSSTLTRLLDLRQCVEAERERLGARRRWTDQLFASLQHRAFRGEL